MRSSTDDDARPALTDDSAAVARVLHDTCRARRIPAATLAAPVSQRPLVPSQLQAKYGGAHGDVTSPPTDRNASFCSWPQCDRRGASCGSSPDRFGTSATGGGLVPTCVPPPFAASTCRL